MPHLNCLFHCGRQKRDNASVIQMLHQMSVGVVSCCACTGADLRGGGGGAVEGVLERYPDIDDHPRNFYRSPKKVPSNTPPKGFLAEEEVL